MPPTQDEQVTIHEKLHERPTSPEIQETRSAKGTREEGTDVAFWQAEFEKERKRLAKLWIAYKDVQSEVERLEGEIETLAERKALDMLEEIRGEAEQGDGGSGSKLPAGTLPARVILEDPVERPGAETEPRAGVTLACDEPEGSVAPGRGTSYRISLANDGGETARVEVETDCAEEGWSALASESTLEIDPDEQRTIHLMVRSPETAGPGEYCGVQLVATREDGLTEELRTFTVVQPPEEDDGEVARDAGDPDGGRDPSGEEEGDPTESVDPGDPLG